MFALTKIILPLQSYKGIMVCTSCKTSKCPKPFPCDKLETGWNCAYRGLVVDMWGGVGGGGKFRFPEVGISATVQKSVILRDVTKSRFSSGYHVTGSNFPDNKDMA